jgi:DNA-binding response OmpR family regulator
MTRTALVVDDNRALAEDLGEILGAEGYQVHVFDDPLRALAECETLDFDVALIDVRMPRLDGVSLHRRLMEQHPHAVFVLMTAYSEDERIAQALSAGVRTVLEKPVALAELLRVIGAPSEVNAREVVLVEDDEAFGGALSEALVESGFVVRHVRTLAAARALPAHLLDTSVVDVRLPDGDGTDLAIELCRRPNAAVVLISGFDLDEPHRLAERVGQRARFLTKPFSPDALLRLLNELRKEEPCQSTC